MIEFTKDNLRVITAKVVDATMDRVGEMTAHKFSALEGMRLRPGDSVQLNYAVRIPYHQIQLILTDGTIGSFMPDFSGRHPALEPDEINLLPARIESK